MRIHNQSYLNIFNGGILILLRRLGDWQLVNFVLFPLCCDTCHSCRRDENYIHDHSPLADHSVLVAALSHIKINLSVFTLAFSLSSRKYHF